MISGTVTDVIIRNDKAKANWVTIKVNNGAHITYMHITGTVKVGGTISIGEMLGKTDDSGSEGASARFGAHVHIFGTWDGRINLDITNRWSVESAIRNAGCDYPR